MSPFTCLDKEELVPGRTQLRSEGLIYSPFECSKLNLEIQFGDPLLFHEVNN